MKKILILALAMVMCLAVLTSCAENDASQTSSRDTSGSRPVTELTDNEPSDKPEKIVVDEDFYKNSDIIYLQQAAFEAYKSAKKISNIDSTPNFYIESLSYDEESKTAVVQIPCVEQGGGPKLMTLTFTKGENATQWDKKKVEYKDITNNTNLVPRDDIFYKSHYKSVQNLSFKFFRAYFMADINTARGLIDSLENPCLEYLNSEAKSLQPMSGYAVEIIKYEYDESGKNGTATVHVWHDPNPTPGNEGIDYMVLKVGFKEITKSNGKTEMQYFVSDYDFDT